MQHLAGWTTCMHHQTQKFLPDDLISLNHAVEVTSIIHDNTAYHQPTTQQSVSPSRQPLQIKSDTRLMMVNIFL